MPHNLPKSEVAEEPNQSWGIPALIGIGAAMAVVVSFPVKKLRAKLYRRGRFMV